MNHFIECEATKYYVSVCPSFLGQILETNFGLTVRFDGRHSAEIEVSKDSYYNKTCGLCGTLDGDPDNDFKHPDGDLVSGTQFRMNVSIKYTSFLAKSSCLTNRRCKAVRLS